MRGIQPAFAYPSLLGGEKGTSEQGVGLKRAATYTKRATAMLS